MTSRRSSPSSSGATSSITKSITSESRRFFILFALFVPVDIVDTLLKGIPHSLEQGLRYDISATLQVVGPTIAAITRNKRYHQFFAIYFLIHTIVISFAICHTLV